MAKSARKGTKDNPATLEDMQKIMDEVLEKPIEITNASIKDMLCNYGYEIKTGPGAGDKIPTRKGSSIVHEDMVERFRAMRVHMAILDDAFKYSGVEVSVPEDLDDHEVTDLFTVNGFKITGSTDNEGYIITGEKWVSYGSISLETPKITSSTGYPFFDQLQSAVEEARNEVEQYMNGKAAPDDDDNQPELPFPNMDENEANEEE